MDKKEFSVSLLVTGLTILFALAAIALFLSNGKSKFWTAKKIKFGAMILTLTVTTQSCGFFINCYAPEKPEMPENNIEIILLSDTVNLNESTRFINGRIYNRISQEFSYRLQNDTVDTLIYSENIIADDGVFDDYTEEFTIELDTATEPGNYIFQLFDINKEEQNNVEYAKFEHFINIKKD